MINCNLDITVFGCFFFARPTGSESNRTLNLILHSLLLFVSFGKFNVLFSASPTYYNKYRNILSGYFSYIGSVS